MAVDAKGNVYAWGLMEGGKIGLGLSRNSVLLPRRVSVRNSDDVSVKAVDVECGYVHSLVVGLDGTLYVCGGVGVDGEADGQQNSSGSLEIEACGMPRQVPDFNIWHRVPEPKESMTKQQRWKKLGKYEVKGRSKMMSDP